MLEIKFIKQIMTSAAAAALVYCITVFFYIKRMAYEESYILYVGNFLFALVIGIFVAWFYKMHERAVSTVRLVVVGAKTAVAGIGIACVLIFFMILIFAPSAFKSADTVHAALNNAPGQFGGKSRGFGSILYFNAILGNMGASFFISLLIPFAVMKNLYEDEKEKKPSPKDENPKKNYNL